MTVINPFDFFLDEDARTFPFAYDAGPGPGPGALPGRSATSGPLFDERVAAAGTPSRATGIAVIDFLVELNRSVQREVDYTIRMEAGVQAPEETLASRASAPAGTAPGSWSSCSAVSAWPPGSCPATWCSSPPTRPRSTARPVPTRDFTDLHAWAEVYVPGAGWIGLDPTSGLFAGEGHLPLACTPDPSTAAPDRRRHRGGRGHVLATPTPSAGSTRTPGSPCPTPTSSGRRSTRSAGRSTPTSPPATCASRMGGEPTFVSIDDMDGDGVEHRRRRAHTSTAWRSTSPGAWSTGSWSPPGRRRCVLHHGQGKWYPGEPLPRWHIAVYWRADGEPLWTRPGAPRRPGRLRWIQDDEDDDGRGRAAAAGAGDRPGDHGARDLALAVAARLGYARRLLRPGLRGPGRHGCGARPTCRPTCPRRPEPARRSWNGSTPGHGPPAGGSSRFTTGPNALGHHPLGPGAAVHLPRSRRLPARPAPPAPLLVAKPVPRRPGPVAVRGPPPPGPHPLAGTPAARRRRPVRPASPPAVEGAAHRPLRRASGTGACTCSCRPSATSSTPSSSLAAVEAAVAATGEPVAARGLPAARRPPPPPVRPSAPTPASSRSTSQPSASWAELVETVTAVYEEARQTRLGTEKFALDGAHTGTGGGNHMTLGGPTAPDSPLLRRPDLLRSLVTYWQHHPSLSYLFSGRFIGPTSQAPRVDEARHDSLDELEIAFAELDRLADATPRPALPRRPALPPPARRRHRQHPPGRVLHRQAVQPRTASGAGSGWSSCGRSRCRPTTGWRWCRRCSSGRWWPAAGAEPYRGPLVRWGTALHDRFLLPYHVAADIAEVVDDLRRHGLPLRDGLAGAVPRVPLPPPRDRSTWTASASSCAWPSNRGPSSARKRSAAPPPATSTRRVERLQVLVENLTEGRHVVTCNGVPVPLHATGTAGDGRGRRPLPGLAAAVVPAPDHRGPRPARLRPRRPLERAVGRRVHLPRGPPRWPGLRSLPGERQRGRGPPHQPVPPVRAHPRAARPCPGGGAGRPRRRDRPRAERSAHARPPPGPAPLDPPCDPRPPPPPDGTRRAGGRLPAARRRLRRDGRPHAAALRPHWAHVGQVLDGLGRRRAAPPAGRRRPACSTTTASPTTSTARRPAPTPRGGASTRSRWCSPAPSGPASRAPSSSGPSCSTCSSPTSTGPGTCSAAGCSRPSWCSATAGSCGPATRSASPAPSSSSPSPPTSPGTATASSGSWPTGPRPRPAPATPSRTARWCRGCSPACTATPRSTGWPRSSGRCGPGSRRWRRRRPTSPASSCSAPGPHSETAFEHALLASRLGYSLVEGSDLTFRDGRIWMRSLGRQERVDVILRRVDSGYCDPLELRPDSQLGVPGLVEACRRGTVTVVNTLGSSVLENPGLLPFLPKLAQTAARAPSWSCRRSRPGGAATTTGLDHVLAHLDQLVLKPLTRAVGRRRRLRLERCPGPSSTSCAGRIEARPSAWVGQAQLALASVPTLTEAGLEARRSRAAHVLRGPGRLLPGHAGGLTRVATEPPGGHLQPDRRPVQGHLGPGLRAREDDGPLARHRPDRGRRRTRAGRCRPGRPRTCSGWAATPSGPRTRCASCGSSTTAATTSPTTPTRPARPASGRCSSPSPR